MNKIFNIVISILIVILICVMFYDKELDFSKVRLYLIIIMILVLISYLEGAYEMTEHMTTKSNEAIQDIASVYNTDNLMITNLRITGNLELDSNLKVNGTSVFNGDVKVGNNTALYASPTAPNMLQIYPNGSGSGPNVYVDNKGNVSYTDGSKVKYQLQPVGDLNLNGTSNNTLITGLQNNVIRKDKAYAVQSSKGSFLIDKSGWSTNFPAGKKCSELMYFRESPAYDPTLTIRGYKPNDTCENND